MVTYKCSDCEEFAPSIKAFCKPEGEHFDSYVFQLGKWIYKHTECIVYSQENAIEVVTELNSEFKKSPMDWSQMSVDGESKGE
jgi:hypothetical protein